MARVVVGSASSVGAVEWTQSSGEITPLVVNSGNFVQGNATGVSDNGALIVGTTGPPRYSEQALQWTNGVGGPISALAPATDSLANSISADGSVIAGDASYGGYETGYMLRSAVLTVIPLNTVTQFMYSTGTTMAANGKVVAGQVNFDSSRPSSVYQSNGTQIFFASPQSTLVSDPTAVSADGSVVVGFLGGGNTDEEPFEWTNRMTTPTPLSPLTLTSGYSAGFATGVSTAGSTIVGEMAANDGSLSTTTGTAFIWDQTTGVSQSLQQVLTGYGLGSELSGWTLTEATAISPDSSTIVGVGMYQGQEESWLVHLTTPTPTPTSPTPTSPTPTAPTPTTPTPTPIPTNPPKSPTSGATRTKTLLTAQPRPSNFGRTVTFIATVQSLGHGGGTPMGDVAFYDGTTLLGYAPLKGGKAKLSTSSLTVTTHKIRRGTREVETSKPANPAH